MLEGERDALQETETLLVHQDRHQLFKRPVVVLLQVTETAKSSVESQALQDMSC